MITNHCVCIVFTCCFNKPDDCDVIWIVICIFFVCERVAVERFLLHVLSTEKFICFRLFVKSVRLSKICVQI